jgi:hypothetical protein
MTLTETTFKEVGMNRREFVENAGLRGVGIGARSARGSREKQADPRDALVKAGVYFEK